MIFFIISESVSSSRELHGKLAPYDTYIKKFVQIQFRSGLPGSGSAMIFSGSGKKVPNSQHRHLDRNFNFYFYPSVRRHIGKSRGFCSRRRLEDEVIRESAGEGQGQLTPACVVAQVKFVQDKVKASK
jgi:hypothetical protein